MKIDKLKEYDPGLLNDYGGGKVDWWFDYIRSLLKDADEHYNEQIADLLPRGDEGGLVENPYYYESEECREHVAFGEGSRKQKLLDDMRLDILCEACDEGAKLMDKDLKDQHQKEIERIFEEIEAALAEDDKWVVISRGFLDNLKAKYLGGK